MSRHAVCVHHKEVCSIANHIPAHLDMAIEANEAPCISDPTLRSSAAMPLISSALGVVPFSVNIH